MRAIENVLFRRDPKRWAEPAKKLELEVSQKQEREAAKKEHLDTMKDFLKKMEDAKRAQPLAEVVIPGDRR